MNLKLKKLTIATAAVLTTGMIGQSQADDLLFPYVVKSQAVTTVISVINTGQDTEQLHYRLWYKNGASAGDNLASCSEVNVFRRTSPNDIQTIDLGGVLDNELGVMFNDPSINNDWQGAGGNFDLTAGLTSPVRGYMVIDDQTDGSEPRNSDGALSGEAFVFEFQSGAAWGYQAASAVTEDGAAGNFFGSAINYTGGANISVMPWDSATTRFFVTPLVRDMRSGNNDNGDTVSNAEPDKENSVRLTMGNTGEVAMYDRDENPVSGNENGIVNCVGAFDAEDLISEGARLQLPDGGWGQLNYPDSSETKSASVIKLEFNEGTSSFAGASSNTFNNAFQLQGEDR